MTSFFAGWCMILLGSWRARFLQADLSGASKSIGYCTLAFRVTVNDCWTLTFLHMHTNTNTNTNQRRWQVDKIDRWMVIFAREFSSMSIQCASIASIGLSSMFGKLWRRILFVARARKIRISWAVPSISLPLSRSLSHGSKLSELFWQPAKATPVEES